MKVGDNMPAALPATSPAAAGRKAGAWQAQLERAWLESWRGGQADVRGNATAAPGTAQMLRAVAAEPERSPTGETLGRPVDAREDGAAPAVLNHSALGCTASLQPELPTAVLLDTDAHQTAGQGGAEWGANTSSATSAPAARLTHAASLNGRRAASASAEECAAGPALHRNPQSGIAPARISLQVAVAEGAAQVTLRDASLDAGEASRLTQAIAHQLLEGGLASVRLYVNGRSSQHERAAASPRHNPDTLSLPESSHINSLERK